jgi:hypothetical protein
MTYYKYAERESDSQVNWAEVSKGLSDTILQVDKDRREKRAAIDAATREAQTTLANAPKGENTTASAWTINYANDMMNYRLTLDRLLKSGQMKLSDYQVAAQNSVDSTNLVFTISKEYQDEYKAIMDRSRTLGKNGLPLSSVMELELASLNESYSNLSNTVPTINSTNGMVYLSTPGTGKDGVQTLGDNYVSLQSLRNRMKAKVDMYDVEGISAAKVASLGENTISQLSRTNFRRTGVVTDITDATLRDTWTEFTKTTAKEMVANPFSQASIMADGMKVNPKTGQAYKGVYNRAEWEADKTGNLILFENTNGTGPLVPVFTEQQTKDAEEFVQAGLSKYVDKKTEKRPFTEPGIDYEPEYIVKNREAAQDADNAQELWQSYFTARTITEKNAAKAGLLGTDAAKKAGLDDIKWIDDNNIELIYANPENNMPISMADASGKRMSGLDWAKAGTEITGIKDVNKLRKYAKTVEGGLQLDKTQMAPGRKGRNENYYSFKASQADQPVLNLIDANNAKETADALNAAYSQYDLSFDYNESVLGNTDEVVIKYKGKKVGNAIPVDSKEAGAASVRGAIEGILKNPPEDDAAAKAAAAKAAAAKKGNSPIAAPGAGTIKGGNVR